MLFLLLTAGAFGALSLQEGDTHVVTAGLELGRLAELLGSERVAVFCFERDHDRCHRQVIVDRMGAG